MNSRIPDTRLPVRLTALVLALNLAACAHENSTTGTATGGDVVIDTVLAPPEDSTAEPEQRPVAQPAPAQKPVTAKEELARRDAGAGLAAPQRMAASGYAHRKSVASVAGVMAMPAAPSIHAEADYYAPPPVNAANTERYQHRDDNAVKRVADEPVSTFSLDVDTGSYSNVRRFLAQGQLPPQDAVRVEELINYFPYDSFYAPAAHEARTPREHPFLVGTELAPAPWNPQHWLLRVSVKADQVDMKAVPAANLVFLVDVSGSMDDPAKLPLLKSSLKLLVDQLRTQDRVSLVVYAGREAVVLEPTAGSEREKIRRAIDNLSAGGSTAGEAGIRLAYRMAKDGYIKGGINRVLIATDGDFNVGLTDFEALKDLVERERESGVQFSSLGFGTGNYNEQLMEQLADAGNGSYAYIDTLQEGRKVLVDQVRSTLVTVASDVKVQVEFNPQVVGEYRLIGYENRMLAREDFNNDKVDAGDVGAGQTVTALYEITPAGSTPAADPLRYVDPLRYGKPGTGGAEKPAPVSRTQPDSAAQEVAFVKLRYKAAHGSASRLVTVPVTRGALKASFAQAGDDFRFATAVAGFGQILRGGKYTAGWTFDDVLETASGARGKDEFGYRGEFTGLVRMAKTLGGS
ncbi:MAG: vWA domain-containing protein [Pseudomonadota bacterium]